MSAFWILVSAGVLLVAACSDNEEPAPPPLFPADYAASYVQVRDCRVSSEHEITPVRVLAEPAAAAAYMGRDADFPEGSILIKEEYDYADRACTGEIVQFTVMQREAAGSATDQLDWRWQKVSAARAVISENEPRCANCHRTCGNPPEGYQGTCSVVASP